MMTIHCSALPRIMSCPASLKAPELVVEGTGDGAAIGLAVHAVLAAYVKEAPHDIAAIAREHGADVEQVRPLYWIGRKVWDEYSALFSLQAVEVETAKEIAGFRLTGRADIIGKRIEDDGTETGVVLDWKTGNQMRGHRAQLLGYAALVFGEGTQAKIITAWLREQEVEIEDIDVDEAWTELEAGLSYAQKHPDTYSPSYENCQFCPRQTDCPGRTALVRQSVADLAVTQEAISGMVPAKLAAMYSAVRLLEQAIDHYHATLRNAVAAAGSLPTGDGKVLTLADRERKQVDAALAWDVLVDKLGMAGLQDVVSVSLPEAVRVAREKATGKRGAKKEAEESLLAALDEAEAVKRTTFKVLAVKKEGNHEDCGVEG